MKSKDGVCRLRHALAQFLARETGEDIAMFHRPAVDPTRLSVIADHIFRDRPRSVHATIDARMP